MNFWPPLPPQSAPIVVHMGCECPALVVEWPDLGSDYVGRNFTRVLHPILWKLSRKIELATQMQTQSHYSSQPFQVTNYGLGEIFLNIKKPNPNTSQHFIMWIFLD